MMRPVHRHADQRGNILEADINPIICSSNRLIAVDALILRRAGGSLRTVHASGA
jgi:hypothetical protein